MVLLQLPDEPKEQKLCPPGLLTQMSFIYFLFIGEEKAMNGYARKLWDFYLVNKLIQLDSGNNKAKKSQSLALAALGALCCSSVSVCLLLLEALTLECYSPQKGD